MRRGRRFGRTEHDDLPHEEGGGGDEAQGDAAIGGARVHGNVQIFAGGIEPLDGAGDAALLERLADLNGKQFPKLGVGEGLTRRIEKDRGYGFAFVFAGGGQRRQDTKDTEQREDT